LCSLTKEEEVKEIISKLESILYFLDAEIQYVTDDDIRANYTQAIGDLEWVLNILRKLTELVKGDDRQQTKEDKNEHRE